MEEDPDRRAPSRLAGSTSAYLRAAADQPIDWYPWGPEAFERARATARPILLDIGASWCHWCHVMDEGTYADPAVGHLLREAFVPVKVDRDEHPEVDRRYQRQVSALTGEGGWPLTAFLTPAGEVFLGGTYFPPTDGHGRPGFRRVLTEVARIWREEPERVRENAAAIQGSIARGRRAPGVPGGSLGTLFAATVAALHASADPVHGGFGTAPKFPHPTAVSLLGWDAQANHRPRSDELARDTLRAMADGGLYDHVGGGFHRYSVDEAWHIPHFEKMAVDNAALLALYTEGFQRFGDARFEEVVVGTAEWATSTLGDADGGFGASQDADNAPGDDGGYFTWSRKELRSALEPDDLRFALRFFGIDTDGRMPHDPERNVLFRMLPPAEAAVGLGAADDPPGAVRRVTEALRAARARRSAPAVDPAVYADLNGRFVAAFVRAGVTFDRADWIDRARRAADRFLRDAYAPDVGVAHRCSGPRGTGFGLLEDQVGFAGGLLELAAARADPAYLRPAARLLELVDREYRGEDGMLRDVAPRLYDGVSVGPIPEPSYPLEDAPHLAANAAAALAFLRLSGLTHDDGLRGTARRLLEPIAGRLGDTGLFAAGSALASALAEAPPVTVVVEGEGPESDRLLRAARRAWHPQAAVFRGRPPEPFSLPSELAAAERPRTARALVCLGDRCRAPITEPATLVETIRSAAAERAA